MKAQIIPPLLVLTAAAVTLGVATMAGGRSPSAAAATPVPGGTLHVRVVRTDAPAGGAARAFCNDTEVVTGGGGFQSGSSPQGGSLQYSMPILRDGTLPATGQAPAGWMAAAANFAFPTTAFVVCATP
jgi:hypothetical protein